MRIIYTNLFHVKNLRKMAILNNLKFYSHLNKDNLLKLLKTHKNVTYIQRLFRTKLMIDEYCPISLEPLKYPFISIRVYNKFNYYDFKTLVNYFLKTKDFRDPMTRLEITDKKLDEINKIISHYSKKNGRIRLHSRSMILNIELKAITNVLNEIFINIGLMETITINYIYSELIPKFIYYFYYLTNRHRDSCYGIINNYIQLLGHHNCDNKYFILDYLHQIISINELVETDH